MRNDRGDAKGGATFGTMSWRDPAWRSANLWRITPASWLAVGVAIGIASAILASFMILAATAMFSRDQLGTSAASPLLGKSLAVWFFAGVVFAPMFETISGQVVPIECVRRFGTSAGLAVLASAAVFSFGHYLNGAGVFHATSTFVGGALFALAYVSLRAHGVWRAYLAAVVAHATHNGLLLFVIGPLFFM